MIAALIAAVVVELSGPCYAELAGAEPAAALLWYLGYGVRHSRLGAARDDAEPVPALDERD